MSRRHRGVRLRRAATLLLALILLAALWELYKLVIPDDAVRLGDTLILPRSDDTSMPHLSQIFSAFGKQEVAGASNTVASSVVSAVWYSLRLAAAGFAVGVAIGFLLALAMQRLRTVERALPYVVLSQTVPLVALAPLVYGWSGNLTLFGLDWQPWMSVAAISAYPAFFPVAIGALRGLSSPPAVQTELLRCYAASWWQTLVRLRLPVSVPYNEYAQVLEAKNPKTGDLYTPEGFNRIDWNTRAPRCSRTRSGPTPRSSRATRPTRTRRSSSCRRDSRAGSTPRSWGCRDR